MLVPTSIELITWQQPVNTLFLNATSSKSLSLVNQLESQGYETAIANSFQAAGLSIERHYPSLIAIDASLEFGSTDALIHIRNMYDGEISVLDTAISPTTKPFLDHLGITKTVRSVEDVLSLIPAEHGTTPSTGAA